MMAGWTMGLEGWLWMAAWAAVVVLAVCLLVREPARPARDHALTLLSARFARGEISADEFERARRLIDHDATT